MSGGSSRSNQLIREFRANQQILRVLEASKALTDSIFDELPIVLVMLDEGRRILKLNRNGQSYFGQLEADVLGNDIVALLPPDARRKVGQYFLAPQDVLSFEDQFQADDNTRRFTHWQISPVYRDRGDGRQVYVMIGHDTSTARIALESLIEMRKDLEIAGNVQSMLLPAQRIVEASGFRMAGHYEPSAQVGGDLWWYRHVPGRGVLSVVVDVMGHGSGSAMTAATIAGCMHVAADMKELRTGADVLEFLYVVDRAASEAFRCSFMVSAVALWMAEGAGKVDVVAGGFPPLFHQKRGRDPSLIKMRGNPLGLGLPPNGRTALEIPLERGDRIICYTDGCFEFESDGAPFGKRRLLELFERHREHDAEATCARVKDDLRGARATEYAPDDITFVVLDCL